MKRSVCEQTITKWERQRTTPEIRFIAKIMEFLEYDPFDEPDSLSERLRTHRMRLGLSQRKLAAKLGIDPATLANWERGSRKPTKDSRKLIDGFLEGWQSIEN